MGVIDDTRKLLQDVVTPDLKAIEQRITAVEQRLTGTEAGMKDLRTELHSGFKDLRAEMRDANDRLICFLRLGRNA